MAKKITREQAEAVSGEAAGHLNWNIPIDPGPPSPSPDLFAARLKALPLEKHGSIRGAARMIASRYPGFSVATLNNSLHARRIGGRKQDSPSVPGREVLWRIVHGAGVDPADLFDPNWTDNEV